MKNSSRTLQITGFKSLILFLIFFSSTVLIAQEIDPTSISISDGLSSPFVKDVFQDSYGLLWIATENGLQKYDGYRFETFKNNPQKSNSLLHNNVWNVLEDSDHNIWAGTDIGVSKYDRRKKTFTNYDFTKIFETGTGNAFVFKLHIDSEKKLWASTIFNEVIYFDAANNSWIEASYQLNNPNTEINHRGMVLGFAEDENGGLWSGSGNYGLMYKSKGESSFSPVIIKETDYIPFNDPSNRITDLFVDSTNTVWITTRKGVYKYNPTTKNLTTLQTYEYNPDNVTNHWNCIQADPQGNIWIANNYRGILKFEGISDKFQEIPIARAFKLKGMGWNITLTRFIIDKSGIFWFGNITQGILKYDPEKKPFSLYTHDPSNAASLSNNAIFGLQKSEINPNLLYVGTRGSGIDIFDQKKQTFRPVTYKAINDVYGGAVRSIGESNDGRIWLGTWGDGIIELDKNYNEIRRYTYNTESETSISDDKVRVIKKDKKGNFWIGTNNGLNYFQPKTGEFERINSKMSRTYSKKIMEKFENLRSSASLVEEINEVTDNQNITKPIEIKQEGTYLLAAVGEADVASGADYGWIENANKDTIWSTEEFYETYYAGGAAKNRIRIDQIQLKPGKYNLRYFSDESHSFGNWNSNPPDKTSFYGIALMELNDANLEKSPEESLGQNKLEEEQRTISGLNITGIALGEKYVWVATNPNGLNRIDPDSKIVKSYLYDPTDENSISSNNLFDVIEDEKGMVWITSDSGINKFNPETEQFTKYTEEDGLPTNLTESILEGDDGEMWISTQSGLSQMVTNESLNKVTFINYNADDGLGGDSFIALAAVRTADGKFYFGGDHGLNALSKITANNVAPDIIISDILISNTSVYDLGDKSPLTGNILDLEKLSLSHDQNNLSFEFAALHYTNPQKNQYAHWLKGYDKDWVYDNRNYASYTNLDPGTYEFIIRASNAYGIWNEEGKSIQVIIFPPWWKTWWAYASYALFFGLFLFIFDRIMRQRLIRRERERSREKELEQAKEIEKAYTELKATQSQLIQSEKMASLGELTAGIAHEIQNPLNFVTNFSEVSSELIDEMNDELNKGEIDEAKTISLSLKQNLEKILHHGKRADAIVKGMLQHSRNNTGTKEPTNINALADEYLRLAYHGLRAKDKSFNANLVTDFDDSIGKINVVPQDIGRVILNLITNAFYATNEKKKLGVDTYEPTVTVHTKKIKNQVEISVTDNGNGIPQKVLDKIFQPFFTTKPTGSGTGLGLSLSYDIVKTHGGEMNVETKEGEGTTFTIHIPVNNSNK